MITYTLKYKQKNQWFWRTVKKVKGDAIPNFLGDKHMMIIKEDESIVMVPTEGTEFKMGKERHSLILKRMEAQVGQKIPLNPEG